MAANKQPSPRKARRRADVGWPSLENGVAAKGWSLSEFAAKIGRTVRAVEAWLYGEQKPPTHKIIEISQLLDVDPGILMADCPQLVKTSKKRMEAMARPAPLFCPSNP